MRNGHDDYPTPYWCVDRLIEAIGCPTGHILEPSAGAGNIIECLLDHRGPGDFQSFTAVEIQEKYNNPLMHTKRITMDFFRYVIGDPFFRFDWAIGNPPYNQAEWFVGRCLKMANKVAMLLRLDWLSSECRAEFLRKNTPSIFVLPNRPSFTQDGRTDQHNYAWFVWSDISESVVRILKSTPRSERCVLRPA